MSGEDGYASPILGADGVLVREQARSRNYVPGSTGWAILALGDAEFNNLLARGVFRTGPDTEARVVIADSILEGVAGIALFSAIPRESDGAYIQVLGDGATPESPRFRLQFPEAKDNAGTPQGFFLLTVTPPHAASAPWGSVSAGEVVWDGQPSPWSYGPPWLFRLTDGGALVLERAQDMTTGLVNDERYYAARIGLTSGANLIADRASIQARTNGAASQLNLNPFGGKIKTWGPVDVGAPFFGFGHDSATLTTTATAYGALGTAASTSVEVPSSGNLKITWQAYVNNSAAGAAAFMSFQVSKVAAPFTVYQAATDLNAIRLTGNPGFQSLMAQRVITGLPPGVGVLVEARYRSSVGTNTSSFDESDVLVEQLL